VTGRTWHDFRRSFASALGGAGIPEAVADASLNRRQAATRGGVLGVNQRPIRWPEQVKAMELWGSCCSRHSKETTLAQALHRAVPQPI